MKPFDYSILCMLLVCFWLGGEKPNVERRHREATGLMLGIIGFVWVMFARGLEKGIGIPECFAGSFFACVAGGAGMLAREKWENRKQR